MGITTCLDFKPDTLGIKHFMISFAILVLVVCTIQFYFAAAHAWVWPFFTASMALAFIVSIWDKKRSKQKFSKRWFACISFFFVWSAFQCIPIPLKMLNILSSFRHDVLIQSNLLTDEPIRWASISYNITESMAWWILMIVLWGAYSVFRSELMVRRQLVILVTILFVLAGLQSLYGILQALIPQLGVLGVSKGYSGYSSGTFFNRNHFAGFIEMMFPLCLGYTLSYRYWKFGQTSAAKIRFRDKMKPTNSNTPVLLWTIILIMMLLAITFSQSRAGIIGISLGLFVFSVLIRNARKEVAYRLWFGLVVIFGVTILYGFRIGFDGITDRFMDIGDGNLRTSFWQDSLPIIKDHPLGIGLMNFKSVFRVYEENTSFIGTVRHTHNDILQLLIETGWPGFIALFGGFIVLLYKKIIHISHMRPQNDPMHFFLAAGALGGLISIGFHSFFDFNLQMPANMVYFVILLAILNVCTETSNIKRQRK